MNTETRTENVVNLMKEEIAAHEKEIANKQAEIISLTHKIKQLNKALKAFEPKEKE